MLADKEDASLPKNKKKLNIPADEASWMNHTPASMWERRSDWAIKARLDLEGKREASCA